MNVRRIKQSTLDAALAWVKTRGGEIVTPRAVVEAGLTGHMEHARNILDELADRETGVVRCGKRSGRYKYDASYVPRMTWRDVWKMMRKY